VNQRDRQAIDELFQHLYQGAQAGPRDPEAEARIQQLFDQGPPGLLYHMAQTLVAQQYALQEARAQLADCQQQSGPPAGFAPPWRRGARQRGYGAPPPPSQQPSGTYPQAYPPRGWQQPGGGGFLAGAGQLALGVGGGILAAEALSGLFSGGGLFGDRDDHDDHDDRQDYDDRDDGQDYADRDDGQDYAGQDDYGGQDPGDGGFGGGGFDGDPGGW
jgi:uncharacterized protein